MVNLKKNDQNLSMDRKGQTFNIGAGLSGNGDNGYNFAGSIDHVVVYNKVLNNTTIMDHADGKLSNGNPVIEWQN